ncbi:MAG: HU family DNA-binding protein [Planctomycetota bacterium]
MTKKEIVRHISEETGLTQAVVKEIVQKTFDAILDSLARGERVELRNFGVFEIRRRAARKARNLSTGEPIMVPERSVVVFKPSKQMESRVETSDQDQRFTESGFIPKTKSDLEKESLPDDN